MRAVVTGVGHHLPERVVTSAEVEQLVADRSGFTLPPGIVQLLTGVRQRHWAGEHEVSSDYAAAAGRAALDRAGVHPMAIDVLITANASHDVAEPATSAIVQSKLGCRNASTMDVKNACNGFLNALDVAAALIGTGRAGRVLVTAGEVLSPAIDWDVRGMGDLRGKLAGLTLGDAGAAFVVEADATEPAGPDELPGHAGVRGIRQGDFMTDGDHWELSTLLAGGNLVRHGDSGQYFHCRSDDLAKLAIRHLPDLFGKTRARVGWDERGHRAGRAAPGEPGRRRRPGAAVGLPAEPLHGHRRPLRQHGGGERAAGGEPRGRGGPAGGRATRWCSWPAPRASAPASCRWSGERRAARRPRRPPRRPTPSASSTWSRRRPAGPGTSGSSRPASSGRSRELWRDAERVARWVVARQGRGTRVGAFLSNTAGLPGGRLRRLAQRLDARLAAQPRPRRRPRRRGRGRSRACARWRTSGCCWSTRPTATCCRRCPVEVATFQEVVAAGGPRCDADGRGGLVQFTSGSLGRPKGVVLEPAAIGANITAILERMGVEKGDVACSWLPLSHDMGFVGMFLTCVVACGPAYGGSHLALQTPESFLADPTTWLRMCSEQGATLTTAPNFAFELACRTRAVPAGRRPLAAADVHHGRRAGAGRDAAAVRRATSPTPGWTRRRCARRTGWRRRRSR